MSLENKIQELIETVSRLITTMSEHQTSIVQTSGGSGQLAPVVTSVAPVAQSMPPLPSFAAAPAPVVISVPFNDNKSLTAYVMEVYKALGAQKGALIQNVLTQLGYQSITEVKPEHYGAIYQNIEALRAA